MRLKYWRWSIRHKWLRLKWSITDPDTLRELSECCMALVAAWIALGILVLALWAAAQ